MNLPGFTAEESLGEIRTYWQFEKFERAVENLAVPALPKQCVALNKMCHNDDGGFSVRQQLQFCQAFACCAFPDGCL